jgi:multicomponent Na+:H+ antiporter subunit F
MSEIIWTICLVLISGGFIAAFIRLARGPSLADRVVALDLLSLLAMGYIIVYAVRYQQPSFFDVAIILALITFLGTAAFAYYLERRV